MRSCPPIGYTAHPDQPITTASFAYQPALDGVRAVAVTLVVLFHAGFGWISGGYVGVSVFFTLSGYLITSLALAEWDLAGRLDVGAFYARRVRRLLPASLACLGGVIVAVWAGEFAGVTELRRDLWGALAQVYNWVIVGNRSTYAERIANAIGQVRPLDHYWSLAIEEQFYWIWPLVLLLILRGSARRRVVAVGSLFVAFAIVAVLCAVFTSGDAVYLATPARLPEILAGCLAAVLLRARPMTRPWVALLAFAGLGVIVWAALAWPAGSGPAYSGWLPLFAIGSAALIAGLQVPSPLRTILSASPFVTLGKISYGVYLFHWPVFAIVEARDLGVNTAVRFAFKVALTFAIAAVSYRLLERPIRLRRAPWRETLALGVVGSLIACAAISALPDKSATFVEVSAVERAAVAVPPAEGRPELPQGRRPLRVMVIGDSTAFALAEGMIRWAFRHPGAMQVSSAAAIGCGLNPTGLVPDDPFKELCERSLGTLPEVVRDLRPDVVVAMVTLRDVEDRRFELDGEPLAPTDPVFRGRLLDGYRLLTQTLLDAGAGKFVWLVPPPPQLPPVGEFAKLLDPKRAAAYRSVLVELADEMIGVELGDLDGWIAKRADRPDSDDGLHLSLGGAVEVTDEYLAPLLGAAKNADVASAGRK